ncbi:MAG: tripartite tricarboxylate transporter substrate binding protein [Burkholderiales bacterium]|nr:tripartite tricarboxylate transporter substrate binding protein [Burkholderiales bacterium]
MRASTLVAAAVIVCAAPASVMAAQYPERPVRLLVPFAPGGGADAVARVLGPKLYEQLGQAWIVDNRGGAAGNIAAEIVVNANPDGHTVFLGFSTVLTVNPHLYKLPFNVERDLIPIATLTAGQYMLVLHPSVTANSLDELIALAKAKPGQLRFSSAGRGSPLHLSAELFQMRTGTQLSHVPYKGGGPAARAVLGGEVHMLFGSLPSSFAQVKAGKLKALAVTGLKRSFAAPDLPTLDELNLKGFNVTSWYGLMLPKGTPMVIVDLLERTTLKVMAMPDVKAAMERSFLELDSQGSSAFREKLRRESETWGKVIREAGIKGE